MFRIETSKELFFVAIQTPFTGEIVSYSLSSLNRWVNLDRHKFIFDLVVSLHVYNTVLKVLRRHF